MNVPNKWWVIALLSALGESKEAVALNLSLQGFRGARGCPGGCPISNYLKKFYPHAPLKVGNTLIEGCVDGYLLLNRIDLFGVSQFIEAFDDGKFPNLDIHRASRITRSYDNTWLGT